jgi:2-polyprenyl-3-methyl-5-hydroxy-6-metoxy-1,4-benzoquinol methylase
MVVDLGCADCHGSHILSYAAKKLTVVDVDGLSLKKAKLRHHFHCPIVYERCDLEKGFPKGEWEVATCFEVIEHLEDADFFLENVSSHLVEGGKFIFSVPHLIKNRLHKELYDEKKIRSLISRHFFLEEFYVQKGKVISEKPMYKNLVCYVGVAVKK